MFCQNCGREVPDGTKFCPYCGAKIDQAELVHKNKEMFRSSSAVFNIFMQIMAGLLVLISIVILIGTFVLTGRIRSSVSTSQISAFASELGLGAADMQNPIFMRIVQVIQNAVSGISRFLTWVGLIIFLILCTIGLISFVVVSTSKKLGKLEQNKDLQEKD